MPTILKASTIITMDPALPRADAVAFDESTGAILAVGSLDECRAAAAGATEIDLGHEVLMPGFVEAHSHPILSGVSTQEPAHWIAPYVGYPTFADVEALFTKLDQETPAGDPLLFNGLDRILQGAPELTAEQLDHYFPSRPVAVIDNSGHEAYFNSATMALLGWNDRTPPPDPVGARWGRNADGTSNGRAYEMATVEAALLPVLAKVVAHPLQSAARWYHLMASNGITATSDMTYDSSQKQGYEALASVPDCPLRVSMYHISTAADCGEQVTFAVSDEMVRKQGIKLWADGSPWVGTIASSFAYLDNDTTRTAGIPLGPAGESMMNYSRSQLDAILATHAAAGWQMAFHVNGDVGLDVVLDAYEHALVTNGLMGTDHRWRVEHCGGCRGDQFERAAAMGVAISLGPFQFIYWGDVLDGTLFPSEIGSQWMRWGDAVRAGARVSFHNDGSVSPPIPLLNIQTAITRRTPSGAVRGPNQIISIDEAMRAETIDAAFTLHRDHEIGSITVGKKADFVQLSKDPYLADPTRLATEVKVVGTWLNGHRIDLKAFMNQIRAIDPTEHRHLAHTTRHCC